MYYLSSDFWLFIQKLLRLVHFEFLSIADRHYMYYATQWKILSRGFDSNKKWGNHVIYGVLDHQGEEAIFMGCRAHLKAVHQAVENGTGQGRWRSEAGKLTARSW